MQRGSKAYEDERNREQPEGEGKGRKKVKRDQISLVQQIDYVGGIIGHTSQSVPRLLIIGLARTGDIEAMIKSTKVYDAAAPAANIRYTWVVPQISQDQCLFTLSLA